MDNNGVGNPTISCNATVDNAGKIGKCYVCASGNHISFTNPITTSTTDFAISCWVYITEYTSGYSNVFSSRTATSGNGLALWITSGSIRFDDGEMWTVSNTFTLNTWTHICVTYSKTNGKAIYVNGSLVGSKSTVGTLANLRSELFIGYDHYGYYLGGKINDLRVWEGSTPSPKEVEVLSMGLVAHYPLSLPQNNLLKNSNFLQGTDGLAGYTANHATLTKQTDCMKVVSSSSNGGFYTNNFDAITTGDMTTFSAYVKADASMTIYIGTDGSGTSNCKAYTIDTTWNQISISKEKTTNNANLRIYGNGTFYTKLLKYELGSRVTPWIPNSADTAYSQLGLSNSLEYDVSGYNYHGTKIGSPTYSSDTPRYSTSTSFNGVDDCIQVPLNTFFPNAGSFTINLWFKKSELGSKGYETVFGGISGFEMDTRGNTSTTLSYYVTGNGRGLTVQSPLNFDTWYMLTMVCDGTNELYYLNGEYKKQIEKKGMPTGNYFIGAWRDSVSQNFKGLISDFRVYATALSATQVARLYNTPVSISNNGTLMGYELVES